MHSFLPFRKPGSMSVTFVTRRAPLSFLMNPLLIARVFVMTTLLMTASSALIATEPGAVRPGPQKIPPTTKPKVVLPPTTKANVVVAPKTKPQPFTPVVITTEMLIFSAEETVVPPTSKAKAKVKVPPTSKEQPFIPVVITTEMLIFSAEVK